MAAADCWGEIPLLSAYGLRRRDGMWDVDRLIRAGSDVNAAKMDGTTVLAIAVSHTRVGMVELLLRSGATPSLSVTDWQGLTPLERARVIKKWHSGEHKAALIETGRLEPILDRGGDSDDFCPSTALVESSEICDMLQRAEEKRLIH